MKKLLFLIIAGLTLCAIKSSAQRGRIVSVKATIDSAAILMGNKTTIHVEVIGDLDGSGFFIPNDSLWKDVEIAGVSDASITDLGNNRKELKKDILIQAFDSGLFSLPTITYVQGADSVSANRITLKVIPVNVDTLTTIHDYADVESPGRNFFDFVPDWVSDYGIWIMLTLIVLGIAIYIYVTWRKKGRIPLIPVRKPVPPYEAAMQALMSLNARNLCETGQEREFYTRLTEILRVYLSGRFGISAMEMTSSQIMRALHENEELRLSENLMAQILEVADFVKFAKVRPLPEDNTLAFKNATKFVEDTKPKTPEVSETQTEETTK